MSSLGNSTNQESYSFSTSGAFMGGAGLAVLLTGLSLIGIVLLLCMFCSLRRCYYSSSLSSPGLQPTTVVNTVATISNSSEPLNVDQLEVDSSSSNSFSLTNHVNYDILTAHHVDLSMEDLVDAVPVCQVEIESTNGDYKSWSGSGRRGNNLDTLAQINVSSFGVVSIR